MCNCSRWTFRYTRWHVDVKFSDKISKKLVNGYDNNIQLPLYLNKLQQSSTFLSKNCTFLQRYTDISHLWHKFAH